VVSKYLIYFQLKQNVYRTRLQWKYCEYNCITFVLLEGMVQKICFLAMYTVDDQYNTMQYNTIPYIAIYSGYSQ
jgi:hypothetical protein